MTIIVQNLECINIDGFVASELCKASQNELRVCSVLLIALWYLNNVDIVIIKLY